MWNITHRFAIVILHLTRETEGVERIINSISIFSVFHRSRGGVLGCFFTFLINLAFCQQIKKSLNLALNTLHGYKAGIPERDIACRAMRLQIVI